MRGHCCSWTGDSKTLSTDNWNTPAISASVLAEVGTRIKTKAFFSVLLDGEEISVRGEPGDEDQRTCNL
jgi:hypothetical protein